MITYLILRVIILLVGFIFAVFPIITVLPWGVDEFLVSAIGSYRHLAEFFPPLSLLLTLSLLYIGFKLGIIMLRFFLGSRTPSNV